MSEEKAAGKSTTGRCRYCNQTFSKRGITQHLKGCKARQQANEEALAGSKKKPKTLYHLVVAGRYATDYWMHLEVDGSKALADLDTFLRATWLECCGHLSQFMIGNVYYTDERYEEPPMMSFDIPGLEDTGLFRRIEHRSIRTKLSDVLEPGLRLRHEYDFGTTTELDIKVIGQREGILKDKWLDVMVRNDPPDIQCEHCGRKPATVVCTFCIWGDEEAWLCADCKTQHQCYLEEGDDYMFLPVVNSPRVGMCAYTGGITKW